NLTLLTGKLNSKVSNGPWLGDSGKRAALEAHDVLLLNRDLLKSSGDQWTDDRIRKRTEQMIDAIIEIWPAPEGHQSGFSREAPRRRRKPHLSDLLSAGLLEVGAVLYPSQKKFQGRVAALLGDGRIEIDGDA